MAGSGVLSKGIKLSYGTGSSPMTFTALADLQEIPDLGGTSESVEITTLDDAAHMYMNGILNYGDSLDFKFLYKTAQFTTLQGFNDTEKTWKVELPDGVSGALDTACTFTGTSSVKLDGTGVNNALTYTLSIKPTSAMAWA